MSRSHHHHHHHTHTSSKSESTAEPMASKAATGNKARINIIYYSMYGHVAKCKFIFKIKNKNIYFIF
jgi:hypothetical protein